MSEPMKNSIRSCLIAAIVFLSITTLARSDKAPICPVNTTYRCGTACPEVCHRFGFELFKCPDECVWGCFCNEGYILETRGGKCMLENDCIISIIGRK